MYLGYRKAVLSGVGAAVILGAGGTALAVSASDTTDGRPTAGPSSSSSATKPDDAKHGGNDKRDRQGKHRDKAAHGLRRVAHAELVTKDKDGTFVTRYVINGSVTSVSASSITVRAEDRTSKTFRVTDRTKVRERDADDKGKPAASAISKIAGGDQVFVIGTGTGTGTVTAQQIVEIAK